MNAIHQKTAEACAMGFGILVEVTKYGTFPLETGN
jgi:hypothetical protein